MTVRSLLRHQDAFRIGVLVCDLGQAAVCGSVAAYAGSRGEIGWLAVLAAASILSAVFATISFRARRPPASNDITITVTLETRPDDLARDLFAALSSQRTRTEPEAP